MKSPHPRRARTTRVARLLAVAAVAAALLLDGAVATEPASTRALAQLRPAAASPAGAVLSAPRKRHHAKRAKRAKAAKAARRSASFTVSSFNVLGATHTGKGTGWRRGTVRVGWARRLLSKHDVDVVGLQEMQWDQLVRFKKLSRGEFRYYPGFRLRYRDTHNTIAWRTSQWRLVEARTFEIPYFDGVRQPMPVLLLQNRRTEQLAFFANVHNPATNSAHPGQDRFRRRAITREATLTRGLRATGIPVILTGDMNERKYVFCRITSEARLKAARGGTNRRGRCRPDRPRLVDWIFGSRRLEFTDYTEDRSRLARRTSDHPMVTTKVTIPRSSFPAARRLSDARAVAGMSRVLAGLAPAPPKAKKKPQHRHHKKRHRRR